MSNQQFAAQPDSRPEYLLPKVPASPGPAFEGDLR